MINFIIAHLRGAEHAASTIGMRFAPLLCDQRADRSVSGVALERPRLRVEALQGAKLLGAPELRLAHR